LFVEEANASGRRATHGRYSSRAKTTSPDLKSFYDSPFRCLAGDPHRLRLELVDPRLGQVTRSSPTSGLQRSGFVRRYLDLGGAGIEFVGGIAVSNCSRASSRRGCDRDSHHLLSLLKNGFSWLNRGYEYVALGLGVLRHRAPRQQAVFARPQDRQELWQARVELQL
jgi:hypothetical protein